MFGFPRLAKLLEEQREAPALIEMVLPSPSRLHRPAWEQEDDITLVALRHAMNSQSTPLNDKQPRDAVNWRS